MDGQTIIGIAATTCLLFAVIFVILILLVLNKEKAFYKPLLISATFWTWQQKIFIGLAALGTFICLFNGILSTLDLLQFDFLNRSDPEGGTAMEWLAFILALPACGSLFFVVGEFNRYREYYHFRVEQECLLFNILKSLDSEWGLMRAKSEIDKMRKSLAKPYFVHIGNDIRHPLIDTNMLILEEYENVLETLISRLTRPAKTFSK